MPIVLKLSQAFYDRFGDVVVDELVGVLNQVDNASQQTLRELNEANFARFDARFERRLADFRVEIIGEIANLDSRMSSQFVTQMRWMIGMWITLLLAMVGLWMRR